MPGPPSCLAGRCERRLRWLVHPPFVRLPYTQRSGERPVASCVTAAADLHMPSAPALPPVAPLPLNERACKRPESSYYLAQLCAVRLDPNGFLPYISGVIRLPTKCRLQL